MLEAAISGQLATDDPEMFATVAPSLAARIPDRVFARCEALLTDSPTRIRVGVTVALHKIENPTARALLLDHPPRGPWLRCACQIAGYLRGDAPAALRADIAQRALADDSPSLRKWGSALLRDLDPETARTLAEVALADEPDAVVRRELQAQRGR